MYIGTDTARNIAKGIYAANFDTNTGKLSSPALAGATIRPSYFAVSPTGSSRRVLYVCNETSDASTISSFVIDPASGSLHQIGQVSSGTSGPCYISVDSTGRSAFVANYNGGSVSTYRIQPDGTLSPPVQQVDFHDTANFGQHGPNAARQDGPHPHCATISPDNRFLLVCDLGTSQISVFAIDAATAHLSMAPNHLFNNGEPGSGSRHIVFHPNGRSIYGVNELDSTVDRYLWTTTHDTPPQALIVDANTPVKTVAADFPAAKNTAAEIAIDAEGFYIYVSNRGEDSLVVFSVDQNSGALTAIQRIPCGGKTPRQFTLDPTGRWLLCGNQGSGTVTVFRRDESSGKLSGPVDMLEIDSPMYTLFI